MSGEAPLVYRTTGGDKLVVASGGMIEVESGGELRMSAGAIGSKGGNAAYIRTTNGVQTLIAAAAVARFVVIHVLIVTTFAAGDGAAPIFDFGETDTPEKFKADLATGTAAAVLTYAGTLSSGKALIVTAVAATGATSTGAITVTAIASV